MKSAFHTSIQANQVNYYFSDYYNFKWKWNDVQ